MKIKGYYIENKPKNLIEKTIDLLRFKFLVVFDTFFSEKYRGEQTIKGLLKRVKVR